MLLLAFGVNHKTAPLTLRERLAFPAEVLPTAMEQLSAQEWLTELVIVSTCNRTELYISSTAHNVVEKLTAWLVQYHDLYNIDLVAHSYHHMGLEAVRHLLRVASGLDSLVLGEPQILGQLKQAYGLAQSLKTLGPQLSSTFQQSFKVAKSIRTQTDIGANAVSVAFASVTLAKQIFPAVAQAQVLLVGAGETIELVARHFVAQGVLQVVVVNRTIVRAERLAQSLRGRLGESVSDSLDLSSDGVSDGVSEEQLPNKSTVQAISAQALSLAELPAALCEADIVVSSTASQLPIIGKGMVEAAIKVRRHQPQLLIDLAVPRDIESGVAELDDVFLYTVDDLIAVVQLNKEKRQSAALRAESMIQERAFEIIHDSKVRQASSLLREVQMRSDVMREKEVRKALKLISNGKDPEQALEWMSKAIVNKLLHQPLVELRQALKHDQHDVIRIARRLLGVDSEKEKPD